MATKRAKTLDAPQFEKLTDYIRETSLMPERDLLIIALLFKAGLRIGEVQKIDIDDMLDVEGEIAPTISIFSDVAKRNRERSVPMNALIKQRLIEFRAAYPSATFITLSSRRWRWKITHGTGIPKDAKFERMSATAVTNYFNQMLKRLGFKGASTHSGRRTFGTTMARMANTHNCSLRDVQHLLGHARLESTEAYLDVSEQARSLVEAL